MLTRFSSVAIALFVSASISLAQQLEERVRNLQSPTAVVNWPGNSDIYVVAERGLGVVSLHDTTIIPPPPPQILLKPIVVDLSNEATLPSPYCSHFGGITGLAFHPEFLSAGSAKRFLYVRFNTVSPLNKMVIRRYYIRPGSLSVAVASATDIYTYDTITDIHSSGHIHFDPNVTGGAPIYLYFGIGDDESPNACFRSLKAQDMAYDLGKFMAVDVEGAGFPRTILARGLRNPFAFSVDAGDLVGQGAGDIWIADTGQSITGSFLQIPTGAPVIPNFAWPYLEGDPQVADGGPPAWRDGQCKGDEPNPPDPYTLPARVFSDGSLFADANNALIGAVVYRGSALPSQFFGRLFLAVPNFPAYPHHPRIMYTIDPMPPNGLPGEGLTNDISSTIGIGTGVLPGSHTILGLFTDIDGELIVLSANCSSDGPNGRIYRLIP